MGAFGSEIVRLLPEAQAGSAEALGRLLDGCRGYLLLVAQKELDPQLLPKGGPSDLVQDTLLDAVRGFGRFQGGSEEELLAWLRRLLLNNLISFSRRYRETDKRQVAREVRLEGGDTSGGPPAELAAATPSPTSQAMRHEEAEALEAALARLPEEYRQVLTLRYREGRSFEEIAPVMGRTTNAVRKLWARAVERLQRELEAPP
jgi:RNA polymerase sigma-70 factor (ECF subfamily)